jgi:hypothetical protein
MTWYWHKWWRFVLSPSRQGVMLDCDGRWVHVIGALWWCTDREPTSNADVRVK